jgi:acetylornithine deacetylase
MTPEERHLIETVDRIADPMVDFASRLVAEPSTLGNEAGALKVMEAEMTALGFDPRRIPIDPEKLAEHPGFAPVPWGYEGRYCLAATRPAVGGGGGRSALFNGHLDVVSPEPMRLWRHDPFDPRVEDGKLYGRGSGDMKSGVAAMTYAAHAVERAGFGLAGDFTLEAVIEEECCGNGALACLAAGYDADAVLIPEPFGPTILTHQVGVLWFKVTVAGVPKHVLEAPAGTNAIEKSYPLIAALRVLEAQLNDEIVHDAYKGMNHPLNLNIGIFRGGDWPSTVPADAEFHGRLSFCPDVPFEAVRQRVEAAVAEAASADPWLAENPPKVEFYGFRSEGHGIPRDLPALDTLNDCHRDLTGSDAAEYIATCTTDLRVFCLHGRSQATCFGPVAENIHGANESVDVESVKHTARAYALFLARWCGLVE